MTAASAAVRFVFPATFAVASLSAQTIPVRAVKADGRIAETFTSVTSIKQFRTGEVMINDGNARRIVVYDARLAKGTLVADTSGTVLSYGRAAYPLIEVSPDSVYMLDLQANVLVMVGASGKAGRVVALPRPADAQFLTVNANPILGSNGTARMDAKGRIVYRGNYRQTLPQQPPTAGKPMRMDPPDTAPVLRGDFDSRTVDTIAKVKIPRPFSALVLGQGGTLIAHPINVADAWTVLTDGTVAFVRAQDYHIDWIDPDGSARATPKMEFAWRRLNEIEKQTFADSAMKFWKHFYDSVMTAQKLANGGKAPAGGGPTDFAADAPNEMPDYLSPIAGVWPDADNHVWILPTTSSAATGGLLYDVVDRMGKIVERVQLPGGSSIAGFGPGGAVYLMKREASGDYSIERVRIVR